MRSFCLASGSSGNSFLIESSKRDKYLVDVGLRFKRINEILEEKRINVNEIKGIFITHEHTDHIQGLEVFMKNSNCPIYLTKGTFKALNLEKNQRFIFVKENQIIILEDIKVLVLGKSHDSNEPVNFVFENGGGKIGIFTDLGFVSSQMIHILKNLDIIYFEANFCEDYTKVVDYSSNYIARLHSDIGHLSVQDSLEVLKQVCNNNQKIILSHISENTNTYENAYLKIKKGLEEIGIFCEVLVSFQGEVMDWVE